ncbi:nucleoside deaminase [Paenibacillus durus]|uniref:CMP/dCMP-type deaminase domain-containing protein n=1 Tax=Paenibacillus durus TaxID=44251 RepID=A0A089IZC4_PAEDU|nr:nucleoside deaminase [Paenibacillus durus]AIQ14309.1 hypothetical protein PDUR_22190 [Paenibacillus durus]
MWAKLTKVWQSCFEEAWESYCHGSIPIGAVLVNSDEVIVSRGRNRINETQAPNKQTCSNRLAHAEINALMQIESTDSETFKDYTLYTTTEPCVLCFGAITMTGIRKVRFAATDPIAGGRNLNYSDNSFIKSRGIDIESAEKQLGEIQQVLMTDYILRSIKEEQVSRFLNSYTIDYPKAVTIGIKWYKENKLYQASKEQLPINMIIDDILEALRNTK